jgi:hypothetical protein
MYNVLKKHLQAGKVKMETHVYETIVKKRGSIELKDLPFEVGDEIRIVISAKVKRKKLDALINNDHVWSEDDIKEVLNGRDIINQWKIS